MRLVRTGDSRQVMIYHTRQCNQLVSFATDRPIVSSMDEYILRLCITMLDSVARLGMPLPEFMSEMHDHKGSLTCYWLVNPLDSWKLCLDEAWEDQGECVSNVFHEVDSTGKLTGWTRK